MVSQAFSASANVLKGDPPTLMAGLLKLTAHASLPQSPLRGYQQPRKHGRDPNEGEIADQLDRMLAQD